jgi:hypothetical protein
MCARPTGGFDRLDRIDFFDYASGTDSPLKMLYIKVIAQAATDYLFFGLGQNHVTLEQFDAAHRYFFEVRSYLRETWEHSRFMREVYQDENRKRTTRRIILSDEELKLMCFDRHYETAKLDNAMHIDRFISRLQEQRLTILAENWKQTQDYINRSHVDEMRLLQALVRPESVHEFAECVIMKPYSDHDLAVAA